MLKPSARSRITTTATVVLVELLYLAAVFGLIAARETWPATPQPWTEHWWELLSVALLVHAATELPRVVRALTAGGGLSQAGTRVKAASITAAAALGCIIGAFATVVAGETVHAIGTLGGAVLGALVAAAILRRGSEKFDMVPPA